MKSFLVAIALVAAVQALTDDQKAKVGAFSEECAKQSGVDQQLVANARKGALVDDPKLKEHLFCFSKKVGFQAEDGEIQKEVVVKKLNAELNDEGVSKKLVEKCALKLATPQETAYGMIECYLKNSDKPLNIV